jgi:CDP-paratose 2-epimerase
LLFSNLTMRILITGICGFVGSTLAHALRERSEDVTIFGFDNFLRPGSEANRLALREGGVEVRHADLRCQSDIDRLPAADWVIDAAANPSVLAGVDERTSSRQLVEHNLGGTINLLEYCKAHRAGLIILSTSRVYSIRSLNKVRVRPISEAYEPVPEQQFPIGVSLEGISENCSLAAPISLYGSTKLASEQLGLEYGAAFDFPVWVNRCGVLAGAGQFGQAQQGIFSFWINAWLRGRPLKYFGFDGCGHQVRDCMHPRDLVSLLRRQMTAPKLPCDAIQNVAGGRRNSMSLAQLSGWCAARFGARQVTSLPQERPFDLPWIVLDCRRAQQDLGWQMSTPLEEILSEIAEHAEENPNWLELSASS